MIKHKWYRWVRVHIFGYRSFTMVIHGAEGDTLTWVLVHGPTEEGVQKSATRLSIDGYIEEWPKERMK